MFKKIWKYFFGSVEFQVDQNGLQYGQKEEIVIEPRAQVTGDPQPLEVNASINPCPEFSKRMNRPHEPQLKLDGAVFSTSPEVERVYIYNISPMEHEKDHPMFTKVVIPACPIGLPYRLAFSLPGNVMQTKVDVVDDTVSFYSISGKRVAMDIVNPNNLGLDQNEHMPYAISLGNDLGVRGVFWSTNNPPTEEELTQAKIRFRKHCKALLEQAGTKVFTSVKPLEIQIMSLIKSGYTEEAAREAVLKKLNITPEHHTAAEYLRVKTVWHPVLEKKVKT